MGRILDRAHCGVEHDKLWRPFCLGCRMAMRKLGTMFEWNQITEWGKSE